MDDSTDSPGSSVDIGPTNSDFKSQLTNLQMLQMQQLQKGSEGYESVVNPKPQTGVPGEEEVPRGFVQGLGQAAGEALDNPIDRTLSSNFASAVTWGAKDLLENQMLSQAELLQKKQDAANHPIAAGIGWTGGSLIGILDNPVAGGVTIGKEALSAGEQITNAIRTLIRSPVSASENIAGSLMKAEPEITNSLMASKLLSPGVSKGISNIAISAAASSLAAGATTVGKNIADNDLNPNVMDGLKAAGIETLHNIEFGAVLGGSAEAAYQGANALTGWEPSSYYDKFGGIMHNYLSDMVNGFEKEPVTIDVNRLPEEPGAAPVPGAPTEPETPPTLGGGTASTKEAVHPPYYQGLPPYVSPNVKNPVEYSPEDIEAFKDLFNFSKEGADPERAKIIDMNRDFYAERLNEYSENYILSKSGKTHPNMDKTETFVNPILQHDEFRQKAMNGDFNARALWDGVGTHEEAVNEFKKMGVPAEKAIAPRNVFSEFILNDLNNLSAHVVNMTKESKVLAEELADPELYEQLPNVSNYHIGNMYRITTLKALQNLTDMSSFDTALNNAVSSNTIMKQNVLKGLTSQEKSTVESQQKKLSGSVTPASSSINSFIDEIHTIINSNVPSRGVRMSQREAFNKTDSMMKELNTLYYNTRRSYAGTAMAPYTQQLTDAFEKSIEPLKTFRSDTSIFGQASVDRASLDQYRAARLEEEANRDKILGSKYKKPMGKEVLKDGKWVRERAPTGTFDESMISKLRGIGVANTNFGVSKLPGVLSIWSQAAKDEAAQCINILSRSKMPDAPERIAKFKDIIGGINKSQEGLSKNIDGLMRYNRNSIYLNNQFRESFKHLSSMKFESSEKPHTVENSGLPSYHVLLFRAVKDAAFGYSPGVVRAGMEALTKKGVDIYNKKIYPKWKAKSDSEKTIIDTVLDKKIEIMEMAQKNIKARQDAIIDAVGKKKKKGGYKK